MGCYSLSFCPICNFFHYIPVPQTQKETKFRCVTHFVKANEIVLFRVLINCLFSINLSLMYLHIKLKAIIVVKEKRNISCYKYHQQTCSGIVILGNEYFLFLLKLREIICYFSDIFGHVACHSRCPSIAGAWIMFII